MDFLQAFILGVVEGITEFLPISSTGHLILTSRLLGIADTDFTKSFEIAIQFGAILGVVALYWKSFWGYGKQWRRIVVAFLPTAIVGFLLYKVLKQYLLENAILVVWVLALGGVALILFELWYKRANIQPKELNYKNSFWVGIAQSLAIVPGLSRSAATIVGGMLQGISREKIVEFSFLLAIPTMAAATGYDLFKSAGAFSFDQFWILAL